MPDLALWPGRRLRLGGKRVIPRLTSYPAVNELLRGERVIPARAACGKGSLRYSLRIAGVERRTLRAKRGSLNVRQLLRQSVAAATANERVRAKSANEPIVAVAAVQDVIATTADNVVVS